MVIKNSFVSMLWNTALTKHCDVIIFLLYGLQNNGVYFRPDSLLSYNDTPPLRISRLHTNNEACKPFFDIGCCCVWSYPYVASFYVSYSSNGNTSFQKQQSSVHFPLQINKFVIVRFTLVFHSILSISLPLFRYILSHNPTYNYRPILYCTKYTNLRYILCYFFPHSLVVIKRERYFDQDTIDKRRIFVA